MSITKGASRMGLATLCSRILGLLREQVFAYFFGASHAADAFNIAFRIPNLLRDLFAEGAMSAAFVPQFTRHLVESKEKAFKLLAAILAILFVGLCILTLFGVFFSPQLVALYATPFKAVFGKFNLTVGLTQAMFPFFPFVCIAAVCMGSLNALGFFFLPAFAPVLFNAACILSALVFCPVLSRYTQIHSIYGMAIGVILGGFLQFYIQWWQLKKQGFKLFQYWNSIKKPWKVPGAKNVLLLLFPGTLGLAATQINILINSIFATNHGSGAVSWLNYAFRLMQFPIGIFGVSLAAATLPQVAKWLALKQKKEAALEVKKALSLTFAINSAAACGLMVIGLPLIQLLFQHGNFHSEDSINTSAALFWYAWGLPAYSVVKVLVPIFYAIQLTKIPVLISFLDVALNLTLNYMFLKIFHYPFWALALSTSLTATVNAGFLCFMLSKKLPFSIQKDLFFVFLKYIVLALLIAGIGKCTLLVLANWQDALYFVGFTSGFWFLEVSIVVIICVAFWMGIGYFLKLTEICEFITFLQKKLRFLIRQS